MYNFIDTIPDLIYPKSIDLAESDAQSLEWYKNNAEVYDKYLPLTFKTFGCDEKSERSHLVDLLELKGSEEVLEIGCGTCRDSELIARRLNTKGKLYLQDISHSILKHGIERMRKIDIDPSVYFSLANGYYLPFPDSKFDKFFHFGGLNTFGDIKRTFNEIDM